LGVKPRESPLPLLFTFLLLLIIPMPPTSVSTGSTPADVAEYGSTNLAGNTPLDLVAMGDEIATSLRKVEWVSDNLRELFNGVPLDIYVVFIGLGQDLVDEDYILSNVHRWYARTDLQRLFDLGEAYIYINFTLNYRFLYASSQLKSDVVSYINNNRVWGEAPFKAQMDTGERDAAYIDAMEFEEWLVNRVRQEFPETEGKYTLVIINTYPDIRYLYFYNITLPDPDQGWRVYLRRDSMQSVAGGGSTRMIFFDISAGPTSFNNVSVDVRPIWYLRLPQERDILNQQLAWVIDSAVIFKFVHTAIYQPIPALDISFEAYYIVNGSQIDPRDFFTPEVFVSELRNLFGGAINITYVDKGLYTLDDFPSLRDEILFNIYPGRGAPLEVVHNWIMDNIEMFRDPDPVYEVPMLILLDTAVGYSGGIALADDRVIPSHIIAVLQTPALTGGYMGLQPLLGYLPAFQIVAQPVPVFPRTTGGEIIIQGFSFGSIDVIVLDGAGYRELLDGGSPTPLYRQTFNGVVNARVQPRGIGDTYVVLIQNNEWYDTYVNITILSRAPPWMGLTTLLVHEAGHILSLNHPHNGLSWRDLMATRDPREGLEIFWLWDMTWGYMTYLHSWGRNDVFQIEQASMLYALYYIDKAYAKLEQVLEPFRRYGFTIIPDDVWSQVGQYNQSLSNAISIIRSGAGNYGNALSNAVEAYRNIGDVSFNVEDYLLSLGYVVVDQSGQPLPNVDVEVTYPNGTVRMFRTDEAGRITVERAPWGDYRIRVVWSGVEVANTSFRETSSGLRTIETSVFRITLVFRDRDGEPLSTPPEEVRLRHDRLGILNYSPEGVALVPGRLTVERVVYLGVDVTPSDNSFSIDGPGEVSINLEVYHLTLSFRDANGGVIDRSLRIELDVAGRVISLGSTGSAYQMPRGTHSLVGVYMEGVNVLPSPVTIQVDGDVSMDIGLDVYRLRLEARDTLGRDLSGSGLDFRLVLRHPNGTVISFSGGLTVSQAVKGLWRVEAVYIDGVEYGLGIEVQLDGNRDIQVELPVGRLSIGVSDSTGSIALSDVEVDLIGPGGRRYTVSGSLVLEYAVTGTYTVESLRWRGFDATPSERTIQFTGGDQAFTIRAAVYSVTLRFVDADGEEIPFGRVSFTLSIQGREYPVSEPQTLLPKGTISITNIVYQGVLLPTTYSVESSPGEKTIQLAIYDLVIRPETLDGDLLDSFGYRLYHPNGSVITGEASGEAVINNLPAGGYRVEIEYLGYRVGSQDIGLSGDSTISVSTEVKRVVGSVRDFLGLPLASAEVRVFDPSTGDLVTRGVTDGSGRFILTLPDRDLVIETGFVSTTRVTLARGASTVEVGVLFTPISLGATVVALIGLVAIGLLIIRRGGLGMHRPSLPRPSRYGAVERHGKICPSCGHLNRPTAKFCMSCGSRLEE